MLPVALDLGRLRVALVGGGVAAAKRLARLEEAGAREVRRFERAPCPEELAGIRLVFVTDVPYRHAAAAAARAAGALVHMEDRPAECDFYAMAVLRRGPAVIGVSTEGRSHRLARALRDLLAQLLPASLGAAPSSGEARGKRKEAALQQGRE